MTATTTDSVALASASVCTGTGGWHDRHATVDLGDDNRCAATHELGAERVASADALENHDALARRRRERRERQQALGIRAGRGNGVDVNPRGFDGSCGGPADCRGCGLREPARLRERLLHGVRARVDDPVDRLRDERRTDIGAERHGLDGDRRKRDRGRAAFRQQFR